MSLGVVGSQQERLANKPCHNCRRNRRRCDRTQPHCRKCACRGIPCLGYGQLFMWTGAVASRGRLAGETSSAALYGLKESGKCMSGWDGRGPQHQSRNDSPVESLDMQLIPKMSHATFEPSTPWALADPLYQDMNHSHRYYLSYFSSRLCLDLVSNDRLDINPFRYLLTLSKSYPLLLQVLVAASAAHLSNSTRYLTDSPNSIEASGRHLRDALVSKHKALQLMSAAVQNIDSVGCDVVLAAALFLINIELIESGRHGWRPHLLGACRLMTLIQPVAVLTQTLRDYIFSDCFVYYILAAAFMPNGSETPTYFQPSRVLEALERTQTNSYFCCPPEILEVLLLGSRLSSDIEDNPNPPDWVLDAGRDLLYRAQNVDVENWAEKVRSVNSLQFISVESRTQAGRVYQLAACVYILHVVPALESQIGPGSGELLVEQIFQQLEQIPEEDPNFKCTAWLTFIAGAAATRPEQRAQAMARLQKLKVLVAWGFINTAMDILEEVWRLEVESESKTNWIQKLKDPRLNFLVV